MSLDNWGVSHTFQINPFFQMATLSHLMHTSDLPHCFPLSSNSWSNGWSFDTFKSLPIDLSFVEQLIFHHTNLNHLFFPSWIDDLCQNIHLCEYMITSFTISLNLGSISFHHLFITNKMITNFPFNTYHSHSPFLSLCLYLHWHYLLDMMPYLYTWMLCISLSWFICVW